MIRAFAALALAASLAGCAAGTPAGCRPQVMERLYFGLASPAGEIGEASWRAFLDAEITPRFPGGLTVIEARGQWRGRDGTVAKEGTRIVEIVHEDDRAAGEGIDALVAAYKARFRQESVLRARSPVEACF